MQSVNDKFAHEISNGTVSLVRETSGDALEKFEDNMFDFVYIDGNHSYDYVKNDISGYYKKIKQGGVLCGDDYRMEDVEKAVTEFVKDNNIKNFRVKNDQFVIIK